MTLSALNVFPESKWQKFLSNDFFLILSLNFFFLVLYFVIKWCFYSFCCNSGNRLNITTRRFSFLLGASGPETGLAEEPPTLWRFQVQSWHEAGGDVHSVFRVWNLDVSDCWCDDVRASQKQQNQMLTSTLPL